MSDQIVQEAVIANQRAEHPIELGARALAERHGRVKWATLPEAIRESYRTMAKIVLEAQ